MGTIRDVVQAEFHVQHVLDEYQAAVGKDHGRLAARYRNPRALTELKEATRLRPNSAQTHHALAEALTSFGDTKAARPELEKAVALDPEFAQARVDLGLALLQSGESKFAAIHLDRSIRLIGRKPDAAYPKYLRARIYSEEANVERAAAELKDAVALRPDFAEAWSDLGQARKTMSDDDGALEAFERSVAVDSENAIAQYRLGAEYLRRGRAHDAVKHLEQAFRLNPDDQSTLNSLHMALRQDGQIEEAKRIKAS